MDDCRLALPGVKLRAVGGGVDRPCEVEARGDDNAVGESDIGGILLSRS